MNFSQEMVRFIKSAIPKEILDLGLRDFKYYRGSVNLDTLIIKNILSEMYTDMSISRGVTVDIETKDMNIIFSDEDETVLALKKTTYPDRIIVAVTDFIMGYTPQSNSEKNVLSLLEDSQPTRTFGYFNTMVEVLSDREIFIQTPASYLTGGKFTVLLSYSKEMREINPHYYMKFGELAIKKAKAWLYNKLTIKINNGEIYHGHNLDSIKNQIDKWEDIYLEYHSEMNTLGSQLLFMNDKRSMRDYIGLNFNIK